MFKFNKDFARWGLDWLNDRIIFGFFAFFSPPPLPGLAHSPPSHHPARPRPANPPPLARITPSPAWTPPPLTTPQYSCSEGQLGHQGPLRPNSFCPPGRRGGGHSPRGSCFPPGARVAGAWPGPARGSLGTRDPAWELSLPGKQVQNQTSLWNLFYSIL